MKFKNWIVRLLGLATTILSILLIYLILFKDGELQHISTSMLIEFTIVVILAVSTKFFWYTSTESSIRSSEDYLKKRSIVSEAIEENIIDAKQFDDFIEIENDNNYNIYMSNHCKNMTVRNYKLSLFDKIHKLFYKKDKAWYLNRYILSVERKANKLHKLSGHNIRSLTQSNNGLTDDRNNATIKKIRFLWTGTVFSIMTMFLTASIVFNNKSDIDLQRAILKLIMYVSQILFSILQAILKARITVADEDLAYFNRILSIIEKYEAYKLKPYTVAKVSYIMEEINGTDNKSHKET